MRHGQTVRNYAKAFFAFATLATVGACADNNSVAPTAEAPAVFAPANFLQVGNTVVFRVNNQKGITQKVGSHVIDIPAGAICDLASGYGPTFWNRDCRPLRGSILITATVFAGPDGRPYIDFEPAMRFSPDKEVMLFFREGRSNGKQMLNVQYCNLLGYCVDESLADRSLKPFRVGRTSIVGRRVKHFSGYVIAYDGNCPGSVASTGDGNYYCDSDAGGFMRKSGYMVASGDDIKDVMNHGKVDSDRDDDQK